MGDVLDGTSEPRGGSVRWEGDTLVVSRPGYIDLRLDRSIVELVRSEAVLTAQPKAGDFRHLMAASDYPFAVIETSDGRVLKSNGRVWEGLYGFQAYSDEESRATGFILDIGRIDA